MVATDPNQHGIRVANKPGQHRTHCPKCSHLRRNKSDRCLSVVIEHDGWAAHCWHCGWTAGGNERARQHIHRGKENQRPDFGTAGRRARYGVIS